MCSDKVTPEWKDLSPVSPFQFKTIINTKWIKPADLSRKR